MSIDNNTELQPNQTILFQGNSITDTGRDRRIFHPNALPGLGNGYAALISRKLLEDHPEKHLQFYNRGVSGDGIRDLQDRWSKDTLPLLPDWISILIGVNDCWRFCSLGQGVSPDEFQSRFRELLKTTFQKLPDTQLILCEPFLLLVDQVEEDWIEDLEQRQQAVRRLAEEFQAVLVPFQTALNQAGNRHPLPDLLSDGVHPTPLGHRLLADCWLETLGFITPGSLME